MSKKKRELIWHYATLIHENLCLKTDCFDKEGKLAGVKYVACIDDDPKSAVFAAWLVIIRLLQKAKARRFCVSAA